MTTRVAFEAAKASDDHDASLSSEDQEMALQQSELIQRRSRQILEMTAAAEPSGDFPTEEYATAESHKEEEGADSREILTGTEKDAPDTKVDEKMSEKLASPPIEDPAKQSDPEQTFKTATTQDKSKNDAVLKSNASRRTGAIAVQGRGTSGPRSTEYDSGYLEANNNDKNDAETPGGTQTLTEAVEAKAIDENDLVDELKEQIFSQVVQAEVHDTSQGSRHKRIAAFVIAFLVAIGVIIAAVVATRKDDKNIEETTTSMPTTLAPTTVPPTAAPTPEPTLSPEYKELLQFLITSFPEGEASLSNSTSPQYRAFLWLAENGGIGELNPTSIKRYAVATFYYAMNGDGWVRNDGWLDPQQEPCQNEEETGDTGVFGLACYGRDDIAEIVLPTNNLEGSFPLETKLLGVLDYVDVTGNRITGTLPIDIFAEVDPTFLYLGSNSITGTIPTEIGLLRDLSELVVDSNSMTGTLPTEIGMLTKLNKIDIGYVPLTGDIPTEIGNLRSLEEWRK